MTELGRHLTRYLNGRKRKRVATTEMERLAVAAGSDYWTFHRCIMQLQEEGLLAPVRASGRNGRSPSLFNRYSVRSETKDYRELEDEILGLPFNRGVEYYLAHPAQYQEDRWMIGQIRRFLLEGEAPQVTVNERSYQVFRDEKALKSGRAGAVLGRLGLTLGDLNVLHTHEPFVFFDVRGIERAENVLALIVENLDAFISLHRSLQAGAELPGGLRPGFLIYGEGKKILQSFQFVREIAGLANRDGDYQYFGDLDYEGIGIYNDLSARYSERIIPWVDGYRALIRLEPDPPAMITEHRPRPLKPFIGFFDPCTVEGIVSVLESGCRIPQEVLNMARLSREAWRLPRSD